MRSALALLLPLSLVVACSYGSGDGFGPTGAGYGSDDDDDTRASSGGTNKPQPQTCTDGTKNGTETDTDCGGACTTKCAVGQACGAAADCADSNLCTGGACAAPNGQDQTKNGDESDVDCGGVATGAARCAVGQACNTGSDCASRGCGLDHVCIEAPSCAVHFGGDTCGAGEVEDGAAHESCCKSLPVDGFQDGNHPGKKVYLDKYEVTAGRVREFVRAVTEEMGGTPNVLGWIQAHQPDVWDPSWESVLPTSNDGDFGLDYIFGAMGDGSADYSSGFYVHGQNCAVADGRPGYPTYWQPDALMTGTLQGSARAFSQEQLDVKSMTCISNAMLAAFCAWDGGQMATADVLAAVGGDDGSPSYPSYNVSVDAGFSGGSEETYEYPFSSSEDNAGRVAPPGRFAADATPAGNGEAWMDLVGNLNEMVLTSGMSFQLIHKGLGYSSAHALQNDEAIPNPSYKAAVSGGRCMRFKDQ